MRSTLLTLLVIGATLAMADHHTRRNLKCYDCDSKHDEVCKCASADLCNAALATSAGSLLATTGLAAATMTSLLL